MKFLRLLMQTVGDMDIECHVISGYFCIKAHGFHSHNSPGVSGFPASYGGKSIEKAAKNFLDAINQGKVYKGATCEKECPHYNNDFF